eukprot:gene7897-9380_t
MDVSVAIYLESVFVVRLLKGKILLPKDASVDSVDEFLLTPASHCALLDSKNFFHVEDKRVYKCLGQPLSILGFTVTPINTVEIIADETEGGLCINVLDTELQGLDASVRESASISSSTVLKWHDVEFDGRPGVLLTSDAELCVEISLPAWFPIAPSLFESAGSRAVQLLLDESIPKQLERILASYTWWTGGREEDRQSKSSLKTTAPRIPPGDLTGKQLSPSRAVPSEGERLSWRLVCFGRLLMGLVSALVGQSNGRGPLSAPEGTAPMTVPASTSAGASGLRHFPNLDQPLLAAGPNTPKPEYHLNAVDRVALALFTRSLQRELGEDAPSRLKGYEKTIWLTQRLARKSSSAEVTQERATRVLKGLLPPGFSVAFNRFCGLFPLWFTARHAAASTTLLLEWLVGSSRVNDAPADTLPDDASDVPSSVAASALRGAVQPTGYKQGVLLERCRVLEESGCASVCLNVCKVPTQRFFTEEINLPLTMIPNYETFECQFVFGATPPPPDEDPAFNTPCFQQ